MKRKDFIKSCLALGCVPFLPKMEMGEEDHCCERMDYLRSYLKRIRSQLDEICEKSKSNAFISPKLQSAPDNYELIYTEFFHLGQRSYAWGMRFRYCPFCGKKFSKRKKRENCPRVLRNMLKNDSIA